MGVIPAARGSERQYPLMEKGNNNNQGGGNRQIFTEVDFLHGRYPHHGEVSVAWRD
ncbi:hypothetical protein KPK_3767 [Klebsiella variicola]|uniref:Uncharacterized protein n=1 Tax=Klebsiella variicola (strain 342) TaxID=507522 RepID=B5XYX1_KLEV3|nr:hypothetical protein KPK_3767 [Klebsiella variicola]